MIATHVRQGKLVEIGKNLSFANHGEPSHRLGIDFDGGGYLYIPVEDVSEYRVGQVVAVTVAFVPEVR